MKKKRESRDKSNIHKNLEHDNDEIVYQCEKDRWVATLKKKSSTTKMNFRLIKNLKIKMSILEILE